jgi:hypothetical protein
MTIGLEIMPGNDAEVAEFLERLIVKLAAVGDPDFDCFASITRQWKDASDQVSFEEVLTVGAEFRSGDRRRKRDRLVCEIRERFFPDLVSNRKAALAISTEIQRYRVSAWPIDKRAGRRSPGKNGAFFQVLSLTEEGLSFGSIRLALANERPLRLARPA